MGEGYWAVFAQEVRLGDFTKPAANSTPEHEVQPCKKGVLKEEPTDFQATVAVCWLEQALLRLVFRLASVVSMSLLGVRS